MTPKLSVIVITPDRYETVALVMRSLHAQENRSEIEILLCAPSGDALGAARPEWNDFAALRVLETGAMRVIAEVKALGVRNATAPVVAFAEEHAFPEPGWARALIQRHQERHAVVGPMIVNPNPRMPISWANLVTEYGPWIAPAAAGLRSHLPGNNSSYKRDVLLGLGDRLAAALDAETLLHWELGASGHTLFLEPAAVTRHCNITRVDSFRRVHFQYSRMFAAQRSASWSAVRKLVYAAGSPLIPAIRMWRHAPDVFRGTDVPRNKPAFWGYLMLALAECARGECAGYLAGPGNSRQEVFELEFHRLQHLDPTDRVTGL